MYKCTNINIKFDFYGIMNNKFSGWILEELETEEQEAEGAVGCEGDPLICIDCISQPNRSGSGCVLEDTELVGGDLPAILVT